MSNERKCSVAEDSEEESAAERVRARRSEMQERLYKIAEQGLRVVIRSEHNQCAEALKNDERL